MWWWQILVVVCFIYFMSMTLFHTYSKDREYGYFRIPKGFLEWLEISLGLTLLIIVFLDLWVINLID